MSAGTRALLAGAVAATALVGAPAAAVPPAAHARLNTSTPAAGAVVAQAPAAVVLTFNRDIAPPATVAVTAPSGDRVGTGDPVVRGKVVSAPIAAREQGSYTVAFRAVSVDGHPITGRFVFSVGHRSTPYATPKQVDEDGAGWLLPAGVGTGAAAVGVGLWVWRRRRAVS